MKLIASAWAAHVVAPLNIDLMILHVGLSHMYALHINTPLSHPHTCSDGLTSVSCGNFVFKRVRLYQLTCMQQEKIKHGGIGRVMVVGFSVKAPGTLDFDNIKAHTKSYLALIFHYVQGAARPQPHCTSATSAVVAMALVVS